MTKRTIPGTAIPPVQPKPDDPRPTHPRFSIGQRVAIIATSGQLENYGISRYGADKLRGRWHVIDQVYDYEEQMPDGSIWVEYGTRYGYRLAGSSWWVAEWHLAGEAGTEGHL